ncbi:hypothetical protein QQF64_032991 [Cirrhinus molitorella]|uniref:C-type lectin domain-containing protein n=1 Tax=Cirrhinus molitorella TaxID=172907 RepID=A0ABR3MSL1_9TELE
MRKLLLLVLTITASVAFASPPVQDENLPDQVVKVPVVEKEPTVEHTEEEAGPLMEDEAVADSRMVEPDSVPEETQVMLEEPGLEADNLAEETEQEPELKITGIQTNKNNVSEEEAVSELESETNAEMEPGKGSRRTHNGWWSCKGVVIQGKCYQFFRTNADAFRAESYCQSLCHNGHLASVTNSYVLGELGKLMDWNGGRTLAWLGGRRVFGTNTFVWLDGSWWSYNGWARGEPNNLGGIENCVETWQNLAFNDEACTSRRPFFCSCPL